MIKERFTHELKRRIQEEIKKTSVSRDSRNCTSSLELFLTRKKEKGLGQCLCLSDISRDLMKRSIDKVLQRDEKNRDYLNSLEDDIKNLPDCRSKLEERERGFYEG